MTKRLQRGAVEPNHPVWVRLLALACLLLVGAASSAQAAHIHGRWLPDNAVQASAAVDASQLPGGEDRCQLCQAMHSAGMPVYVRVEPVRLVLVEVRAAQVLDKTPESHWHYAMFSRPPPVVWNLS